MKSEIRRYYKSLRNRISDDDRKKWDKAIRDKLYSLDIFKNASSIFTYLSVKDEVDTKEIIKMAWKMEKKVYIPKITDDKKMIPVLLDSFDSLSVDKYNIESSKNSITTKNIDISLVPGLSFDKNKYRIGYGGGFYDNFIKEFKSFYVGLFYDISESFNLKIEENDQKLDMIITDKKII